MDKFQDQDSRFLGLWNQIGSPFYVFHVFSILLRAPDRDRQ